MTCKLIVLLQLLTRLRLGLSHLREHKFKHNFQDTLNPIRNFVPLPSLLFTLYQ